MRSDTFYLRLLIISLLWFALVPPLVAQEAAQQAAFESPPPGYRLGPGDVVQIQVFGEPDLSPQLRVGEDGTIDYPFLGDIPAAGLTLSELEARIDSGLRGDYLITPRVATAIVRYRSFYILGQVRSPGGYPFQPGLTVERAVSLAGGFSERASKGKIYVVREGGRQQDRQKVPLDYRVQPGDVITVEQSFF